MKRLAWYTAVGLATLAALFLLWEFRIAILLFLLSLVVAAILRPMIDFLTVHKVPRSLALTITYLGVVAIIAALVVFLGGPAITELQSILVNLPVNYGRLRSEWQAGSWVQHTLAQSVPDLNSYFKNISSEQWNGFIQNFLTLTLGSINLFSELAVVIVISIYWSADEEHFKRLWLSLLPYDLRARWRDIWQNVENEIGAYLRSELVQSLFVVIILSLGYQMIGLNYPVLLAVFEALSWLIIWFGGLAAVVVALISGLAISPAMGFLAAFFTIAVLSFVEFIIGPRLFNNRRLSSLLMVILLLLMLKEFGLFGALFAPPLAAAIQIFASQLIRPTQAVAIELEPPPEVKIDLLRERLDSVQAMVNARAEPASPEIINLIDRLGGLIDRTNQEEEFTE